MTKERIRPPRAVRKHLRKRKAELRRTLSPAEAQREIDRLVRQLARHSQPASPTEPGAAKAGVREAAS